MSLAPAGPPSYAHAPCEPCRKGKRRCNRALPACELCTRKNAKCSYPPRRHVRGRTSKEDELVLVSLESGNGGHQQQQQQQQQQGGLSPSLSKSAIAAIYFVAPQIFQQSQLELPRDFASIPDDLNPDYSNASRVRSIVVTFFETVHWCMPIISKKSFFSHLLNPLSPWQGELSLLTLCMQLYHVSSLDASTREANSRVYYQRAKRLYFELEAAGIMSLRLLQANILIALYEMSQAVYPAAYLTIGACARYAAALGVNDLTISSTNLSLRPWPDAEEGRRAWWAILLLDRVMNLGDPTRPLATQNPTFDSALPVDDSSWDDGISGPNDVVSISTGYTLEMGLFSRLAQATYLLSQALDLVSSANRKENGDDDHELQIAQLRRTIHTLASVSHMEVTVRELETCFGFCPQTSICASTIFILQDHQWSISSHGTDNAGKRHITRQFWDETSSMIKRLVTAASCYTSRPVDSSSRLSPTPFFAQTIYQATCLLINSLQGLSDMQTEEKIELFRELLRNVTPRWKIAGVYLNIIDAKKATSASEGLCGGLPSRYSSIEKR